MQSEADLIAACVALIGGQVKLSPAERKIVKVASDTPPSISDGDTLRRSILRGADPLGDAFSRLRSADQCRTHGAVYTPDPSCAG